MATPVQQGSSSSAVSNGSAYSSASYLYAEIQHSGIGKQASPACRIPRAPMTPRPLNQAQQRNVVRKWMRLPPIESNWQRASRQFGAAANGVLQTAEQSLAQMTSLAGAAWDGMREAFVSGVPSLHIGPPGAAAETSDIASASASSNWTVFECLEKLGQVGKWMFTNQKVGTVAEMLVACPTVDCSADENVQMKTVTVVIESHRQLSALARALANRGAKVFISAQAFNEFDASSPLPGTFNCMDMWFGSYTKLGNVTPAEWLPASGGSVVLLSSQEFAERLDEIRNVSYPSCDADADACVPVPNPVSTPPPTPARTFAPASGPAPEPSPGSAATPVSEPGSAPGPAQNELFADSGAAAGSNPQSMGMIGVTSIALVGVAILGGAAFHIYYRKSPGANAAHAMNNVVVIPSLSTNPVTPLAGTVAQTPAPAAHVTTGQTAAATTGLTVATSLPAPLQAQTPIYDSSYPPAGQPGGH